MARFRPIIIFSLAVGWALTAAAQSPDTGSLHPPIPVYKVDPKHPEELFAKGIEGEATVIVIVDVFGSAIEPEVESASREEFGLAALFAAAEWTFEPATKNGVPIEVRAKIPFTFNISFEHKLNLELEREVFKKIDAPVLSSSELDKAPLPTFVPAFADYYPQEFKDSGKSASLSVEFIIAPDGAVHNPRIINASTTGFKTAALRAVSNLRYQPVLVNSMPVHVSMLLPIQMSE